MNVNQLSPIIVALFNAGRTGMFWGAPGIGKSYSFRTAAKAIAESLGLTGPVLERHEIKSFLAGGGNIKQAFGMFDVRLSQSDPVDVGGLPRENKVNNTMERLPPSWFPHTLRHDLPDYGILLLDELPSAPLSVQTAAYQITLDGVIDEHGIKEGWQVFAAGNRLTDGGQFFKLPAALANRLCHIDVESSVDSWTDWAIDSGMDHSLIAFIRFRPDLLNTFEEHAKKGKGAQAGTGFAFATERMWEAVNDFLVNNPSVDPTSMTAIISGMIGEGNAAQYMAFRKTWHAMPNIQAILVDPDSQPVPEDAATQFAVCTALAAQTSYNSAQNAFEYVDKFTQMGRAELSMLFVKDLQRRQGIAQKEAIAAGNTSFMRAEMSPAYTLWAQKNKDLLE